jgi:tetratricopeptide (TPR) repeat protein
MRAFLALILCSQLTYASSFEDELARAHFLSGQSYFDEGRFADALHEFREAYTISRRPGFQYNIGVCETQLGHTDAAIAAFERYLKEAPSAPDRATVEQRLNDLRGQRIVKSSTVPLRKRPWFIGVMTGTAVAVTAAIVVGVVVGTQNASERTIPDVSLR